eukprot:2451790-Amphidinium_carterae.1
MASGIDHNAVEEPPLLALPNCQPAPHLLQAHMLPTSSNEMLKCSDVLSTTSSLQCLSTPDCQKVTITAEGELDSHPS